jgi:heptaprenyl diphosphate synthase
MYAIFFSGKKEAVTLAFLKAVFSMLLRGPIAGLLSLTGGLISVIVIILLWWVFKNKISYVVYGVFGAIGHNIGQLAAACLILQDYRLFIFYFPILLVAGAVFGAATGILLKIILPVFDRLYR